MKTLKQSLACVALLAFLLSCSQEEDLAKMKNLGAESMYSNGYNAWISHNPVIDPINGGAIVGTSKLVRNKHGVSMNLQTSGLIPGHTYTVWWVVWNAPENCAGYPGPCEEADFAIADLVEVDVLFATGHVVGGSGKGNFAAHLKEGDTSGSIADLFGIAEHGLKDAKTAEVHLVVRSHGPAIPGMIDEQIHSFGGGCTDFLPGFVEIPDEVGECADIQFAIHQ